MATVRWQGGAANVAQVDTFTPGGTIEATDVFAVVLSREDGGQSSVSVTAGGTSVAAVASALFAALSTSIDPLFEAIVWQDIGTAVRGTARIAGVPFYATTATTETGGGAADDQTFVRAAVTASSGPNDWAVGQNWQGGSPPSADDDVVIAGSTSSILFGLRQSSLNLGSLKRGRSHLGDLGDRANGYPLQLGTVGVFAFAGVSGAANIQATITEAIVTGTTSGDDAVVLAGTVTTLHVVGQDVRGNVRLVTGLSATTINWLDVAPTAVMTTGSTTSITTFRCRGGRVEWRAGNITTLDLAGGTFVMLDGSPVNVNGYVGTLDYRSAGTITALNLYGATLTTAGTDAESATITNATVVAGLLDLRSSLGNVILSNDPVVKGGRIEGDVGQTVNPQV